VLGTRTEGGRVVRSSNRRGSMEAARIVRLAYEAREGEWASPLDRTSLVCGARRQREWEVGQAPRQQPLTTLTRLTSWETRMLEWLLVLPARGLEVESFAAIESPLIRNFAEAVLKTAQATEKPSSKAICAVGKKLAIVGVAASAGVQPAIAWNVGVGVGIVDELGRIVHADSKPIQSIKEIGNAAIEEAVERTGYWAAEVAL
jgi:hypothetical protein